MKRSIYRLLSTLAMLTLFLSACGTAAPDAAAIATSAVQTVEARYTEQAAQQPTLLPPTAIPPTLESTSTPPAQATQPTQPTATTQSSKTPVTPCLSANYVSDVTIADYTIIAPGTKFIKTWRVKNTGSCPWDSGYKLIFDSGNSMGATTSFSLPQVVYQDQTVDISIELTAPSTEAVYTGYWKLATSFGGTIGFGQYNAPLSVIITSSANAKKDFSVASVTYDPVVRTPKTGCPVSGALFTVTAYITVNGPGVVNYHIVRNPDDGSKPDVVTLNFKEAGTKAVTLDWLRKPESLQQDLWMAVYIDSPNDILFDKVPFNFSCP
jgi:hypothetical protein